MVIYIPNERYIVTLRLGGQRKQFSTNISLPNFKKMQNKITLFGLLFVHLQATEQQYHDIFHIKDITYLYFSADLGCTRSCFYLSDLEKQA